MRKNPNSKEGLHRRIVELRKKMKSKNLPKKIREGVQKKLVNLEKRYYNLTHKEWEKPKPE